jgi:hypothetical protein
VIIANTPGWAGVPASYPRRQFHTMCAISSAGKNNYNPSNIYGGGNLVSFRLRQEGQKGD